MSNKLARRIKYIIRVILAYVVALLSLAPLLWMVVSSFKKRIDIIASPPKLFFHPTMLNYHSILHWKVKETKWGLTYPIMRYYQNSLIVSFVASGIALLLGIIAAYSLSRFKSKKREWIEVWILSTIMAPPIVFAVPYFLIAKTFGLFDSYTILIIASTTISLPFAIWMMRSFFDNVPRELEEAAYIDGCSSLRAFVRITLPLAKPGIMAALIILFINAWNNLIFPLTLTADRAKTIPAALQVFLGWTQTFYGMIAASGVLAIIPVAVIAFCAGKGLISGLTLGAVKE